jgi:hypothetical protein
MSLGVTRYIEVQTEVCERMIYFEDLYNIGKWKDNDIVQVYNENQYYKIQFGDLGIIHYTPIESCNVDNTKVVFHASSSNILPIRQLPLYNGVVYSAMVDGNKRYFEYREMNNRFMRRDTCPTKWVMLKFTNAYDITQISACINSNTFINNYLYSSDGKFAHRGLPTDISDDIKNDITEYDFRATYVMLNEIEHIYNQSLDDLNKLIKKYFNNAGIDKIDNKILLLLKHFNINTPDNIDKDVIEYFEEDFEQYLSFFEIVSNEITQITTLVNTFFDTTYISSEKIRITYTFNN